MQSAPAPTPVPTPPRELRRGVAGGWHAGACFVSSLVMLLFLVLAAAGSADSTAQPVAGRCEIKFFATSTKGDFSGGAATRPFSLTHHEDASGGPGWWSASVELPVLELVTGSDQRDGDMHWMFDARHFPRIGARFPHIAGAAYEAEPLDFLLTIRDVTRPMTARVSEWVRREDRIRFEAQFEVSATDFKLHVPTLLGFLRVEDVIVVRAHVELEGAPPQQRLSQASVQGPRSESLD
jgi:polyisoprenoid-binding protein YceI